VTLDQLVRQMLLEHTGGEEFFTNLDAQLSKHPRFMEQLFERYYEYDPVVSASRYIVTGKFGLMFSNWLHSKQITNQVFLLQGGLRYNPNITDLSPFYESIVGNKFVFFDDSLYSGGTRDCVATHLKTLGGELEHSFVIYDGSLKFDPKVTSLYRYYDEDKTDPAVSDWENEGGT